MDFQLDRPATPEETAAIAATVAILLADEGAAQVTKPAAPLDGWAAAARIESLGIVRRVPGQLDLRYMSAPTRERLTRPDR